MYKLYYIETSMPSYFGGHHLPVIQIMIDGSTTYEDVKKELLSCMSYEHIDDVNTAMYKEAVEKLFYGVTLSEVIDDSISYDDDDYSEYVFMFFALDMFLD